MKKYWFVLLLCILGCTAFAADRPNILFILVDDLGYGDVGFNGSTFYETPNIDKLADTGLIIENSYMYPTCSPSRTAIATGKQSFRTGVYTVPVLERGDDQVSIFSRWTVGEEHIMYSQPLAEAGYKNIHLGKWHLVGPYPEEELNGQWPRKEKLSQPDPWDYSWAEKHKKEYVKYYPEGRGYLKNIGGTYRGDPALEIGGYKGETGGYWAPFNNPFIPEKNPKDKWLTDYLTTEAIKFMGEYKEGPFFINLHYYTVHAPVRGRSEELVRKYLNKPGDPESGQGMQEGKRRRHTAEYATMIESLDDNVGRLVEFLEKNGLRENTLILFSSDNGWNAGINNRMRGKKGYIWEGGIRVPTFINWPGHVTARRTEVPVHCVDYFPTFMDLAGIHYTGTLDGESIVPLFRRDDPSLAARPLFWHLASEFRNPTSSIIRKNDMKLVQFLATGEVELYNLKTDPKEEHNIAANNPELTEQLLRELKAWRKTNNVPLPPNAVVGN
ncbi:sulfatase [Verrucomicrobia bacterium S94]|nr:sulfatase [Verrucomicrobia bacterium S94]